MNLVILLPQDWIAGNRFGVSGNRATHLREVLKVGFGDEVRVGMIDGPTGIAEIAKVTEQSFELECEFSGSIHKIHPTVDLLCAIPRPKTLKKVLLNSAMMGVRRLMLVRANRTDRSYLQSPLLTPEGWTAHLLDGLAQGGITQLPRISVHTLFRPFVEDELPQIVTESRPDALLLPDPGAFATLDAALGACDRNHMLVAIGPEGGWVPFELNLLETQGFIRYRLGPWTLRVEAALVAMLAQFALLCDDELDEQD